MLFSIASVQQKSVGGAGAGAATLTLYQRQIVNTVTVTRSSRATWTLYSRGILILCQVPRWQDTAPCQVPLKTYITGTQNSSPWDLSPGMCLWCLSSQKSWTPVAGEFSDRSHLYWLITKVGNQYNDTTFQWILTLHETLNREFRIYLSSSISWFNPLVPFHLSDLKQSEM